MLCMLLLVIRYNLNYTTCSVYMCNICGLLVYMLIKFMECKCRWYALSSLCPTLEDLAYIWAIRPVMLIRPGVSCFYCTFCTCFAPSNRSFLTCRKSLTFRTSWTCNICWTCCFSWKWYASRTCNISSTCCAYVTKCTFETCCEFQIWCAFKTWMTFQTCCAFWHCNCSKNVCVFSTYDMYKNCYAF